MYPLTIQEFKNLIQQFNKVPNPPTFFLLGDPGIGKSYGVREVANEMGRKYIPLSLGRLEAPDLKGMPDLSKDYMVWKPPVIWQKIIEAKGNVVLHLDEFTIADEAVQDATLDLIHDKTIDDVRLPKNTMIVLSGNTGGDDGTNARAVSSAITGGRTCIFKITRPSTKEWLSYQKPVAAIKRFVESTQAALVSGADPNKPFEPWTCPRSFSKLDEAIKDLGLNLDDEHDAGLALILANGYLKADTAQAFGRMLQDKLLNIEKLLKFVDTEWVRWDKATDDSKSLAIKDIVAHFFEGKKYKDDTRRAAVQKFVDFVVERKTTKPETVNAMVGAFCEKNSSFYEELTVGGKKAGELYDGLDDDAVESSKKKKGSK